MLRRGDIRPAWALGLAVAGVGALLAIGWELGEYVTFIRGGTELATAYTDTLGDEALGSLGAVLAGVALAVAQRRSRTDGTVQHRAIGTARCDTVVSRGQQRVKPCRSARSDRQSRSATPCRPGSRAVGGGAAT